MFVDEISWDSSCAIWSFVRMLPAMPFRMALMPVCVTPKVLSTSVSVCCAAALFEPPEEMSPKICPKLMLTVFPTTVMMPWV